MWAKKRHNVTNSRCRVTLGQINFTHPADAQILADCAIGAALSMAPDEKSLYNSNKLFVSL